MSVEIVYETHSISVDNERGVATGWLDGELSERGRELALELGRRRRDDDLAVVFSSDLRRAVETAEIAFGGSGIPIRLDARLRECNYGELNGAPVARIESERSRRIDEPYPGGESYRDCVVRMSELLDDLAPEYDGKRVLLDRPRGDPLGAPASARRNAARRARGRAVRVAGGLGVHPEPLTGVTEQRRPVYQSVVRVLTGALALAALLLLQSSAGAASAQFGPIGEQRIAVVLATWGPRPVTVEQARAAIAETEAYIRAASFGRTWLDVELIGWVEALPARPVGCNTERDQQHDPAHGRPVGVRPRGICASRDRLPLDGGLSAAGSLDDRGDLDGALRARARAQPRHTGGGPRVDLPRRMPRGELPEPVQRHGPRERALQRVREASRRRGSSTPVCRRVPATSRSRASTGRQRCRTRCT